MGLFYIRSTFLCVRPHNGTDDRIFIRVCVWGGGRSGFRDSGGRVSYIGGVDGAGGGIVD